MLGEAAYLVILERDILIQPVLKEFLGYYEGVPDNLVSKHYKRLVYEATKLQLCANMLT